MKVGCEDCRHCLRVYDDRLGCVRWACTILSRMVSRDTKGCGSFTAKVPQVPYIPRGAVCKGCRHGLAVKDNRDFEERWVCLRYNRLLTGTLAECKKFEAKAPQMPFQQAVACFDALLEKEAELLGERYLKPSDYPRLLDMQVLKELRLALHRAGELVLALELQPRAPYLMGRTRPLSYGGR